MSSDDLFEGLPPPAAAAAPTGGGAGAGSITPPPPAAAAPPPPPKSALKSSLKRSKPSSDAATSSPPAPAAAAPEDQGQNLCSTMDAVGALSVRFHFGGEFFKDGKMMHYRGGNEAVSYIDRDKVSLPEVVGQLLDHCSVPDGTLLHWLCPGKELEGGLRVLVDDKACLYMSDCIVEGGVAEIYVEGMPVQNASADEDSKVAVATYFEDEKGSEDEEEEEDGAGSSEEDSDYMPGDDCSSEEDEEAVEILKRFKDFKRKLRRNQVATLDDVEIDRLALKTTGYDEIEDEGNDTPYDESDDEESVEEVGSDGELRKKRDSYKRFNSEAAVPRFELGMKFSGRKEFKNAIVRHCLHEKKVINFIKDEPTRVRAKCDWPNCPWVCLCSKNSRSSSWQIVTLKGEHNCPPRRDNKYVTCRRIAEKYEKFIMANPAWKIKEMKTRVQEEMFADVSISKLKKAKAIVMEKVLDSTKGQYERLYDYQMELHRSNPGSTVVINSEDDVEPPTFRRMYICLDACKKGFMAGCRKVVGLDSCLFKSATNGELLHAIGRDANNQMFPIAWAVVDKENDENWDWFCDLLFRDISVDDGKDWVFISNQKKGILNAVDKWAPEAEHRNCARHIYANWKEEFSDKDLQKKFRACAKAPCIMLFNLARARLAQHTREGAQAILNTHPQHWSRAWFRLGSNCDSVDNNLCESFNKWIVEARTYPIITMLEAIRRKVMVRIQEQRSKSERWMGKICPNILKKLNTYVAQSRCCHAISNGADKFEVEHFDHRFIVDLEAKTCSCRYWQLAGLPCCHAISSIYYKKNTLDDYIADCYTVDHFNQTYSHCVQPVEGMESWPVSPGPRLGAPSYVKMPRRGRPKKEIPGRRRPKKERRELTEVPKGAKVSRRGTVIRCGKCRGIGHNRATCERSSSAPSPITGVQSPLNAIMPVSQQSSNTKKRINNFQEPASRKKAPTPMLLLPPWDSAKL